MVIKMVDVKGIAKYMIFPTCCGVDVHKSFLVATIIKTPKDSLQPNYQKKRFSTFNSDLNLTEKRNAVDQNPHRMSGNP